MRGRWQAGMVVAVVAAAGLVAPGPAGAAQAAGGPVAAARWGMARNIPGLLALNRGGGAGITGLSCGGPGDCGTGGWYTDAAGRTQAFVASQRHGVWGRAEEVAGTAALNTGGVASVAAVSCPAAGECTAVGSFTTRSRCRCKVRAFTVTEAGGVWGAARLLPGRPGAHGYPVLEVLSCAAPGECSAGGSDEYQGVVATETGGRWQAPRPVPGLAALNTGRSVLMYAISCAAPGECSVGGSYTATIGRGHPQEAFVASQRHGVWGRAEEVPGTAALNSGNGAEAEVTDLSCTAPGDCTATGGYDDSIKTFVVTQAGGVWGRAEEAPGTGAYAGFGPVACTAPGDCTAVGGSRHGNLVIDQVNGAWQQPRHVATTPPGAGFGAALSCPAPGDCGAGGSYAGRAATIQAFVITETAGHWGHGEAVPGSQALNTAGDAQVTAISCAAPGHCTAAGFYFTGHTDSPPMQVFVVSQS